MQRMMSFRICKQNCNSSKWWPYCSVNHANILTIAKIPLSPNQHNHDWVKYLLMDSRLIFDHIVDLNNKKDNVCTFFALFYFRLWFLKICSQNFVFYWSVWSVRKLNFLRKFDDICSIDNLVLTANFHFFIIISLKKR